ncbi:cytochrome P450 [Streptomyces sp. H39-S7]|uniref:cytochrome P450 n=1 Tax=Streptomyces sp. H39-S7 TaxID=3004357 RepID=UPI0022AF40ED|nr:cytochrome P450 [Streptomyces sp. H39-S7]MCZ4125222.1 cytochrome P450 [Streptomyces sp. H39-S7]
MNRTPTTPPPAPAIPAPAPALFPAARGCPFAPPQETTRVQGEDAVPRVSIWNGTEPWLFTRYDDVRTVLSDPRFSADKSRPGYPLSSAAAAAEAAVTPTLLVMDNPAHDTYRRLVQREFTVRRAEEWRPTARAAVDDALDALTDGEQPADLVAHVALPVALSMVCVLLGVPFADRDFFRSRTHTANSMHVTTAQATAARAELQEYLQSLVRQREKDPGDDFISRLAVRHLRTGAMSEDLIAAMALLLLTAGHDTTANMIALGTLALLRHPDSYAALHRGDDPALAARTTEELLRYLTIVQRGIRRIAVEDVTVGRQLVRAGEGVIAAIDVANRDPGRFRATDTLDTAQNPRDHLAFGYGPHQCLGQSMARVELQEAYQGIARRLPGLRPAVPLQDIRFKSDMAVYGVHELPVRW